MPTRTRLCTRREQCHQGRGWQIAHSFGGGRGRKPHKSKGTVCWCFSPGQLMILAEKEREIPVKLRGGKA